MIFVTVVLLIVATSAVTMVIHLQRAGSLDHLSIRIRGLYGAVRYHYEMQLKMDGRRSLSIFNNMKGGLAFLKNTEGATEWAKETLRKIRCTELRWMTHIGVQDAAATAICVGSAWAVKSAMLGFLFQFLRLKTKPVITVSPQYNQTMLTTEARVTLKVRAGSLIWSMFRLMMRIFKAKGGKWLRRQLFRRKRTPAASKQPVT